MATTVGKAVVKAPAKQVAKKTAKTLAIKAPERAQELAHLLGEQARKARTLPIQRSVDVAVPLEVAWDEWMRFDLFTEGVHRVQAVERDGDGVLVGELHGRDWEAEITDERQDESFAWQSTEGSDVAGLVTFHRISDRLTRIELNLDVVPTGPVQTMSLLSHVADRRAGADLRRFKARVEALSPDEYDQED